MVTLVSTSGEIVKTDTKCKCGECIVYETNDFIPYCPKCYRQGMDKKLNAWCVECGGGRMRYSNMENIFRCPDCKRIVNVWKLDLELILIKKELRELKQLVESRNGE